MNRHLKVSILLILSSLFVAIVSLFLVENWNPRRGVIRNIQNVEIPISEGTCAKFSYGSPSVVCEEYESWPTCKKWKYGPAPLIGCAEYKGQIRLKYKYVAAICLISFFLGLGSLTLSAQSKSIYSLNPPIDEVQSKNTDKKETDERDQNV